MEAVDDDLRRGNRASADRIPSRAEPRRDVINHWLQLSGDVLLDRAKCTGRSIAELDRLAGRLRDVILKAADGEATSRRRDADGPKLGDKSACERAGVPKRSIDSALPSIQLRDLWPLLHGDHAQHSRIATSKGRSLPDIEQLIRQVLTAELSHVVVHGADTGDGVVGLTRDLAKPITRDDAARGDTGQCSIALLPERNKLRERCVGLLHASRDPAEVSIGRSEERPRRSIAASAW